MQPGIRHVYYIGGATPQELGRRAIAEQDFKHYEERLDFTYLNSLPLPQLLDRLTHLPSDSIVLFTTFFKDAGGQPYVPLRACPLIVDSSNVPVYGSVETLLGCGIVGGSVFDVEEHVRQAAQMGLRILRGEAIANLPVEQGPPDKPYVDWRQIKKWDIPESRVAAGTIVMYREPTVWELYSKYILIGVVLLLVQAGLIVVLWSQIRRRKRQHECQSQRQCEPER